jgi:hypothetical protein
MLNEENDIIFNILFVPEKDRIKDKALLNKDIQVIWYSEIADNKLYYKNAYNSALTLTNNTYKKFIQSSLLCNFIKKNKMKVNFETEMMERIKGNVTDVFKRELLLIFSGSVIEDYLKRPTSCLMIESIRVGDWGAFTEGLYSITLLDIKLNCRTEFILKYVLEHHSLNKDFLISDDIKALKNVNNSSLGRIGKAEIYYKSKAKRERFED